MGLTGFAHGWWLSVLGVYLLGVAAWLVRGERLRPTAVPIPADHPAHGPPPPAPPAPEPSATVRRGILLVLLVSAARAIVNVLKGRP